MVPIHKTLLDLGFLEYVKKVKSTGSKLLFPEWKPSVLKASPNAVKWFTKHLKDLELHGVENSDGKALRGAHAFRHNLYNVWSASKT